MKRKGGQEEGKDKRKGTKEGKRERPLKIGHFGRYAVWVRLVLPPELKCTRGGGGGVGGGVGYALERMEPGRRERVL